MPIRIVMVFGTFDGLHDGHRAMLKEAKSLGDYLIAVVAQDEMAEHLKKRKPRKNAAERMEDLKKVSEVNEVVLGDNLKSSWEVVRRFQPDIIAIGHDQYELKNDLERNLKNFEFEPKIIFLKYHERNSA